MTTEKLPANDLTTVDNAYNEIEKMYKQKLLDDNSFYKCCCSLAYEYILLKDLTSCTTLLSKCTPEYFKDVMPRQAQEDPVFADVVVQLAELLIDNGAAQVLYSNTEEELRPTQLPAKA